MTVISPVFTLTGVNGYRLTGEWQYAASYKDGSSWTPYNYASGATAYYHNRTETGLVAWYYYNSESPQGTSTVGTKGANALGIHDMSGNVWEFCWDWSIGYPAEAQTNYRGPASGEYRIKRGGSYYNDTDLLQVGYRDDSYNPFHEFATSGFRVARSQ